MLELGRKMGSHSQIVPIILGERTNEMYKTLLDCGYLALPIHPPTVPPGTSRLRISLTAEITAEDLEELIDKQSIIRYSEDVHTMCTPKI
jgi:8-amino-7-oxononanoate synthase